MVVARELGLIEAGPLEGHIDVEGLVGVELGESDVTIVVELELGDESVGRSFLWQHWR